MGGDLFGAGDLRGSSRAFVILSDKGFTTSTEYIQYSDEAQSIYQFILYQVENPRPNSQMHGDIPTTRRFVTPAIQRDTHTAIPDKSRYPPRQDARRQQQADIETEQTER